MKLYIEEINAPCLEDEEYRYLEMRSEGRKYYNIYRGIKNNKGVWVAVEVDGKTMKEIGEPFEITYDQGRGFEPIDPDNNKLQKTVGRALGLRRESINESPVATISTDVDTFIIPDVPEENADAIISFATKTDDIESCEWYPVDGDLGEIEIATDPVFFKLVLLWAYRKKLTISDKRIGEIMRDNNIYESKRIRGRSNLTEKSNFDSIAKAVRYYYPKWYYDDMSIENIFNDLEKLGHTEDFIDAVIDGITEKYEDEEDYGLDEGVEIEVKNKGVLEVPEGKNVDDLPMSHFEKLVKKNGLSKITKALNNLQVWNKNDDKKLSKWAADMIEKLTKKYGKNESLKEDTYKSYWKYDVESDVFNRNEDSDTYLTKYDIRKVKLIPCKTPEECYDDERYWAVCKYEYPYDEFYGTKQEAYNMLLTSWNNSKYERIHDI